MSDLITDEMVVATAKRLDPDAWEMTAGDYQDAYGRSYGNSESSIRSARQIARSHARAILRLAAPLIAAKALRSLADDMDASWWEHVDDWGVPVIYPNSVRVRADAIEAKP